MSDIQADNPNIKRVIFSSYSESPKLSSAPTRAPSSILKCFESITEPCFRDIITEKTNSIPEATFINEINKFAVRQRMRDNLDKLEAGMRIGTSVLVNKYTLSLGIFKNYIKPSSAFARARNLSSANRLNAASNNYNNNNNNNNNCSSSASSTFNYETLKSKSSNIKCQSAPIMKKRFDSSPSSHQTKTIEFKLDENQHNNGAQDVNKSEEIILNKIESSNQHHSAQQQQHNHNHHKAKNLINEIRNELGLFRTMKSAKLTGKSKLIKSGLLRSDSTVSVSKVNFLF